jgi:hypothetical protein
MLSSAAPNKGSTTSAKAAAVAGKQGALNLERGDKMAQGSAPEKNAEDEDTRLSSGRNS